MRDEDFEARVERRAVNLLMDATDPALARELAWDWELLVNHEVEIVRLVAEALHACMTRCLDNESRRDRLAALGADVMDIAMRRAREIARHQIEKGTWNEE